MTFFAWLSNHWQFVSGWLLAAASIYKFFRWLAGIGMDVHDFFVGLAQSEKTLHLVATNHLPHLQTELEGANEGIADLQISQEKTNELLSDLRGDIASLTRVIELSLLKGE